MNCPLCSKAMTEEDFGGVAVDVCSSCGGIWFDWMELRKLDETREGMGSALKKALEQPVREKRTTGALKCPRCDAALKCHKYQFNKNVDIDECYACGGFFLDSGELKLIRQGFMSEEIRQQFLESLLNDIPEYMNGKKEQEDRQKNVSAFDRFCGSGDSEG
ncbi:MAG: zf-TFIIB domain-containing protein [Candidatus Wallbacteria bacterium]|nr:zf-TFIIB domain-containing protein [Candidatus Wallbacteria bacterium]